MVDAFPTQCGEISLDYSSTNQIEEFTVTFRHQYWVREQLSFPSNAGPTLEDKITDLSDGADDTAPT